MSDDTGNNIVTMFNPPDLKIVESANPPLETYEAVVLEPPSKRSYGIRINYSNGEIVGVDYALFRYYLCSSPERLVLFFNIGATIIDGKNLDQLLDYILDQRIRAICAFNPDRYKPLKDGEVRIDMISWQSKKAIEAQIEQKKSGEAIMQKLYEGALQKT